jgi:hypothetical protein
MNHWMTHPQQTAQINDPLSQLFVQVAEIFAPVPTQLVRAIEPKLESSNIHPLIKLGLAVGCMFLIGVIVAETGEGLANLFKIH